MLDVEEVRKVKEAIGMASWKLDLWRFAEIIGSDSSHVYTQEKFRELSALSKALGKFDAETLTKIINAVVGE